jgi:hypothetical protein
MVWIVRIHTIPKDKREALIEYCRVAQERDPTFKFAVRVVVQDDKVKGQHIIIDCPDKTTAFKRGVLLHHRFGAYFEVEFENRPFGYKMEEGE